MSKHTANDSTSERPPQKSRARTPAHASTFVYRPRDWVVKAELKDNVALMVSKYNAKELVVKKVMARKSPVRDAPELQWLKALPHCNRIVKPILCFPNRRDNDMTAIFRHYPMGDLYDWRRSNFVEKLSKPVPESYIWRMFVQIAQALAFIQNKLGPRQHDRIVIIHRDIKPKNILVVDNGSTYPSFKLIDFGLAMEYVKDRANEEARVGTFEWQPPENPMINRRAADVWALGACVHFLATGSPPLQNVEQYSNMRYNENQAHPSSVSEYKTPGRYYAAHVPREVMSLDVSGQPPNDHQYSHELDRWMKMCLRHAPGGRPTAETLARDMVREARTILRSLGGQAAVIDLWIEFGPKAQ
jgi:serine/threonine protein kinase